MHLYINIFKLIFIIYYEYISIYIIYNILRELQHIYYILLKEKKKKSIIYNIIQKEEKKFTGFLLVYVKLCKLALYGHFMAFGGVWWGGQKI